jgi:hypothetical protein
MQYLLLIYANEAEVASLKKEELGALHQEYLAFTKSVAQSGNLKSNNGLRPVATATTVRVRGGKTVTTDGPFAETREQLAGYFLIEAKDLDEATAIAARIPTAKYGSIEVRPTWGAG